jgi:multicomponent Na+:H+ antiporter subunit G
MEDFVTLLVAALIVIGAFFALVASIGILRLPDIYSRMHAASKAGTLGSGVMLIALAIYSDDLATTTRALIGVVFFLLTAPISSHLLAKAAYAVGYRMTEISVIDEMGESLRNPKK